MRWGASFIPKLTILTCGWRRNYTRRSPRACGSKSMPLKKHFLAFFRKIQLRLAVLRTHPGLSRLTSATYEVAMAAFFLWVILFILCWPIALLALVLYPIVWLLTLPFRIVGIAVHGILGLFSAMFMLPIRLLRGPRAI